MNRFSIILVVVGLALAGYVFLKPKPDPIGKEVPQAAQPAPAESGHPPPPNPTPAGQPQAANPPPTSAPAQKMSEDEFREKLQSQFETSFKEGQAAEDASATAFFINETLKGFNLNEHQKEQVEKLMKETDGELERAGNEAQKDRIHQEAAERLRRIIGAPNP